MKAVYKESKMFDRQTKCTLNQLFTSVSMAGGEHLSSRFSARQISTPGHLRFGEKLLIKDVVFKVLEQALTQHLLALTLVLRFFTWTLGTKQC